MIYINQPITISYTHDNQDQVITSVRASIIDAYGQPIPLSSGVAANLVLTVDAGTYNSAPITIPDTVKPQEVRVFFEIKNGSASVLPRPGFSPLYEELGIEGTFVPEYVSDHYFQTYFIAQGSKIDPQFEEAINAFLATSPTGFKPFLDAATVAAEKDLKMLFGKTLITEQRDYYGREPFSDYRWMLKLDQGPIVSLETMQLFLGNTKIADVSPTYYVIHKYAKEIEIMPVNGLVASISINNAVFSMSPFFSSNGVMMAGNRLPGFFRYTYFAGLDLPTLPDMERENLKQIICLKAAMSVYPNISPESRQSGISLSVDGVSNSINYRPDQFMAMIKKEYQERIATISRQYNNSGIEMGFM